MTLAPSITIFVRHSPGCKYAGDEFCKRCNCRKHLRWTQNGEQYRRKAGTRSWAEAETVKRELEDQLSGRVKPVQQSEVKTTRDAVAAFVQEKTVQGVVSTVLKKYDRELNRLADYLDRAGVFTLRGLTREILTAFIGSWDEYKSSSTKVLARRRLLAFLRYCNESGWIDRVPKAPVISMDYRETEPLTEAEFKRLLDAPYGVFQSQSRAHKIRVLFLLMRWSGLSLQDAVTLERKALTKDPGAKGIYRVTTQRVKMRRKQMGHVSVPIPESVAKELIALENGSPKYFFWTGNGTGQSVTSEWNFRYIKPCFDAAKIEAKCYLKSHRLRDTFAVDLLSKGVPLEEVSKLLGHKSIVTTERHYAKWVKARQDRLDNLVTGTWGKQK